MVEEGRTAQPFFSIGVTTYNRHDLLRETLNSVIAQDFGDFEIIIGNDYQAEVLTCGMLGICDQRIRIINHPVNLREAGNMNALLAAAKGRYFTWLFDDDLYEPGFLRTAHDMLKETDNPPALFPSFKVLWESQPFVPTTVTWHRQRLLNGREFLSDYFNGRLNIVSTGGLFDTALLRSTVGGIEELCPSAIGLYGEFLFLVRCALLGRIVYFDAPFMLMRSHEGSWSETNLELDKYLSAGQELVRKSAAVLRHSSLIADIKPNLLGVCRLHLYTFAYKSARLEIARGGFRPGAAWRAIARLADEQGRTRRTFAAETGMSVFGSFVALLPVLIRHVFLVLGTVAVHLVRSQFPGFLKRSRPDIGV